MDASTRLDNLKLFSNSIRTAFDIVSFGGGGGGGQQLLEQLLEWGKEEPPDEELRLDLMISS